MFWGESSVNDAEIARIKSLADAGVVKYVLGFNEPDLESQADLTVEEAIAMAKTGGNRCSIRKSSPCFSW